MHVGELKGNIREKSGTGPSHDTRRRGKVPGVVYGKNINNLLVEFSEMELNNIIKEYGEHAVVNINVNGSNIKTMIKEIQREPVKRNLVHVDMKSIKEDEKVQADVPVVIKGEDYVRSRGGIVQKQLGTVSVMATPDRLPKYLVADVSKLGSGHKLTIADMEFSSEIAVLSDMHSVVALVTTPREKEDLDEAGKQDSGEDNK